MIIIHLEKPSATDAPPWPSAQQQMICSFTQLLVGVDSTHMPLILQGIDLALSFITYTTRGELCCRTMCKVYRVLVLNVGSSGGGGYSRPGTQRRVVLTVN